MKKFFALLERLVIAAEALAAAHGVQADDTI